MTVLLQKSVDPEAALPRSVAITTNGVRVGDPLRDNNYSPPPEVA